MCKNKTVQQIPMRKDLICENCGKPLRECPPPPDGKKKFFIAGGVIAAVAVACGLYFGLKPSEAEESVVEPPVVVQEVDTTAVDTLVAESPVVDEKTVVDEPQVTEPTPKPTPKPPVSLQPSWGTYTGERDGSGKPNGQGELKITRSHEINGEMAQPGESIKGVFRNGYVNMGKWYKSDGNVVVVKDIKVI
jgi:hypothetical protein